MRTQIKNYGRNQIIYRQLPLQYRKGKENRNRLSEQEALYLNKKIVEEINKKIIPLKTKHIPKHHHNQLVNKSTDFYEQNRYSPKNSDNFTQNNQKSKSKKSNDKKRTLSMDFIDNRKPISQSTNLCKYNQLENVDYRKKIIRERSMQQQFLVIQNKIKEVCLRANKHLQQRRKIQIFSENKSSREYVKTEEKTNFKILDLFQVLRSSKLKNNDSGDFPGRYKKVNSIKRIAYTQVRNNQNRQDLVLNQKLFKQLNSQSEIDEIDKQFEKGLVQQLYTTQRVKLRKNINKKQWEKRQLNPIY